MIRINLLKGRTGVADRLPPALTAEGYSSRFLTQRELVLAVALVAIGGGIIAAQVYGVFEAPAEDDPYVATYERPGGPPPATRTAPTAEPEADVPPATEAEVTEPVIPPAAAPETVPASLPMAFAPEPTPVAEPIARAAFGDAPGHTVTGLRLVEWGEAIEVFVDVAGTPEYRSFWVNNPDRLVIDLEDSELRVSNSELNRSDVHPLISQLRAAQNSFDPPLVRIVVQTARSEGPVEITPSSDGISVKLTPAP
jgi:hypothetical protein